MIQKKCVVLDLDNTLWGGVVGEDGIGGIRLSTDQSGAGFMAFQQALKDLYDRGVILAINSQNNFNDAMAVIRTHPNMILKERHFAARRINWQDKVLNLKELAQELNIGLDAMVFLDDDPINRAAVRARLPAVEAPELPAKPDDYAKFLRSLPYFPAAAITDEDKMRGNLYVTERLRQQAEKTFASREEFLKNLGLELQIFINDSSAAARLAQLTEKTNQFNVNKVPLTEAKIIELMNNPSYQVLGGRLTDRFGDHGIIIFAVVARLGERWRIDYLLMSCRVIGRGAEEAFLAALGQLARSDQAKELTIIFKPTEKNQPAAEFVNKYFKSGQALIDRLRPPAWITVKYGKI